MIKKIIALYLVLFTSLSFTQAQGIEFFHGTYDEAMQKAKTERIKAM
jgi:hypothetical protein